jgi:tetratricopeptide (TPR) repeat protein
MKRINHSCISLDVISKNTSILRSNEIINKQEATFMFAQLLKDVFVGMVDTDRSDMIHYCRRYADNPHQIELIDRFEHDYERYTPVWWYSLDTFLYRMLNKALRTQDISTLYPLRTFARDLHNQPVDLCNTLDDREPLILFRGQLISTSDYEKIQDNIGGLLSISSFLSTSLNEKVAFTYAGATNVDTNETATIFRITVNSLRHSNVPLARIQEISQFNEECEYLFSMGSVFRIHKTETMLNSIECIHLELTNDHDAQLFQLTNHMRQKLKGRHDFTSLGLIMWEIGDFKKAEEFYLEALERETNPLNLAALQNQLGAVFDDLGNHCRALEHYQQSIKIKQSHLPADHPSFAAVYSNIGLAYQNLGNNELALEYLQKALAIGCHTSESNQILPGTVHNSIAGILDQQGQYNEALEHYQRGLEYKLVCLPEIHPDVATSYSDIAFLHIEQEGYEDGLSMLTKCLEMQKRSLPDDHPSLINTYNHMTLALAKLERYPEAYDIGMKAIDMASRTLGDDHEQTVGLRAMLQIISSEL